MSSYISDIRQGDTKTLKIDFGKGNDVTAWEIYFILRERLDDTSNLFQTSTMAGMDSDDDPENGLIYLTLSATQTAEFEIGTYAYAIKVDKGNGDIQTLLPPIDDANEKIKVVAGMAIE